MRTPRERVEHVHFELHISHNLNEDEKKYVSCFRKGKICSVRPEQSRLMDTVLLPTPKNQDTTLCWNCHGHYILRLWWCYHGDFFRNHRSVLFQPSPDVEEWHYRETFIDGQSCWMMSHTVHVILVLVTLLDLNFFSIHIIPLIWRHETSFYFFWDKEIVVAISKQIINDIRCELVAVTFFFLQASETRTRHGKCILGDCIEEC